jgi:HSP20 family protein
MQKWDPLRELRSMQEEMNRLFERSRDRLHDELPEEGYWQPPVDIFAEAEQVVVKMEIPEVRLEDIEISVEDGRLSIEGERRLEAADGFLRLERSYGPFRRLFELPIEIDRERIAASCADGVLKIVLPRKSPTRRQIDVAAPGE